MPIPKRSEGPRSASNASKMDIARRCLTQTRRIEKDPLICLRWPRLRDSSSRTDRGGPKSSMRFSRWACSMCRSTAAAASSCLTMTRRRRLREGTVWQCKQDHGRRPHRRNQSRACRQIHTEQNQSDCPDQQDKTGSGRSGHHDAGACGPDDRAKRAQAGKTALD